MKVYVIRVMRGYDEHWSVWGVYEFKDMAEVEMERIKGRKVVDAVVCPYDLK